MRCAAAPLFASLLAASAFLFGTKGLAGGMTSSGGELVVSEDNPWFVGGRPVSYCIVRGEAFSLPESVARVQVVAALQDWVFALAQLGPRPTPRPLADGELKNLTLQFFEEPCGAQTELTFRLGAADRDVDDALRQHARFTLALALHAGIDEHTGRAGRAQIWLVPDQGPNAYAGPDGGSPRIWSRPAVVRNVLLHELGHLFGLPHMDAGFMHKNFPAEAVLSHVAGVLSAQSIVDQSWLARERLACGRFAGGPTAFLSTMARTAVHVGDQLCLNPVRTDDGYEVQLLPARSTEDQAQANASPEPGAGLPDPIGWPARLGVLFDSQKIAGTYVAMDASGREEFWEHAFVAVPRLIRLRGTLATGAGKWPLLLEQRAHVIELIVPHAHDFAVFRLELGE